MATSTTRALPESYFALVREFPLIPIRDQPHLSEAQAFVDRLLRQDLDEGGETYLDALSDFITLFEAEHESWPDAAPEEILLALIDASPPSQQQLARTVGIAQSTISAILNGTRKLTTDHMVRLGRHFGVEPAVFLPR